MNHPDAYQPTPRDRAAECARLEATRPGYREARTVGAAFRAAFGPEARETWEQVALELEASPSEAAP